jgi:hypothetical protein
MAVGAGSLIGVGINFTPLRDSVAGQIILLFIFFCMPLFAGYATARFSAIGEGFNGAVAGLASFSIPVMLAAIAQPVPLLSILGGAILAAGFGFTGSLLARARRPNV